MENEKKELIGMSQVDNGVDYNLYLTKEGLRYSFSDVRDEEESELFSSPYSVLGMSAEKGYSSHIEKTNPVNMVKTLAIIRVRNVLGISFDKAKELLEG